MSKQLPPIHPGAFLKALIQDYGISMCVLSKALCVSTARINQIVHGKRAVTPDTAMRLALYFGGDAQSWVNWQAQYDLKMTQQKYAKELSG